MWGLVKMLLPIVMLIVLFIFRPLYGLIFLILFIGYLLYKNLPLIYCYLGNVDYINNRLEKAEEKLRKAYKSGRVRPKYISAYAYILLKVGKADEAYSILSKLYESKLNEEEKVHVKTNLALTIWKKGDLDQAVSMFEEIYNEIKTTNIYGCLGYLLILKGDLDRALQFNLEAYEYNNTGSVIADNMGQTYYLLGEYDKAAEVYEKLISANPSFPEAYYNYGLVLAARNDKDKAVEMMNKALAFRFTYLSTISREEVEAKLAELGK